MYNNITIKIKDILESYSYPVVEPTTHKRLSVDEIIANGKQKFFDFYFPWYSNNNSGLDDFEVLFLHRNYMKQIGCETVAMFKNYIQAELMEKMPEYKKLYETTLIEYDPLVNRKLTTNKNENEDRTNNKNTINTVNTTAEGVMSSGNNEERETNTNGSSSQDRTDEINNQSIHSENPEITMSNKDYASSMDRGKKTDVENTTASGEGTSNEKIEGTESSNSNAESNENTHKDENEEENRNVSTIESVEGFYGESQAEAILKYRETILNLNKRICEDLDKYFLGYYGGEHNLLCW